MPDTTASLLSQLATTQTALNIVWTIIAACLVMFMQLGFAMLETGFSRTKNVAHTMAMNFLVYSIGVLAFWAIGFGLQMGGLPNVDSIGYHAPAAHEFTFWLAGRKLGLFGTSGFFLPPTWLTPGAAALFMFQVVFMDTATIIPTGALIERWKYAAFCLFSLFVAAFIYPVFANWVWGGGFLSALGQFGLGHGHVDFAGSSVVHMTGGVLAFLGATLLGPRIGKFGRDGQAKPIPAHSVPLIVCGTFVLAFGWFGFNAGSTLAGTEQRLAVIALNTMLSSAAGATVGAFYSAVRFGRPDVTMMCNGMLAGLVAITAPCAFVAAWAAVLIGCLAGVLVIESTLWVERKLLIDDPVGAISVHGVCGAFGALCVGIFADGSFGDGLNGVPGGVRGILYGDVGQLIAALVGIGTNMVWVGTSGTLVFLAIDRLIGNRVSIDAELAGLDVSEMGMEGYYDADDARPAMPERPSLPPAQPTALDPLRVSGRNWAAGNPK
jgi:Amt family ammonium transporter